ncbi:hypothetical protein KUTeg_021281 [Tegillarca granosa]|uniref:Protein kinase domain-containing protein n=1 Tax=Tegillarca granosa TaxID=220873 RepID=A0ABQ9ECL7_TEGGR|nr:hypothetical protein KUTeg_021281 [Tegillarca granosa]
MTLIMCFENHHTCGRLSESIGAVIYSSQQQHTTINGRPGYKGPRQGQKDQRCNKLLAAFVCYLCHRALLLRSGIEPNPGPGGHSKEFDRDEEWCHTENYSWKSSDILGRGATAVVVKCRAKGTREIYAAKVFNGRVSTHFSGVPVREMEVLTSLKHRNIIGILAIEREIKTGNQVLIMEFCSGGSLYSMLDQSKYAYGFPEEEFLIVLNDIAEGMKYLRQKEFVHRDIKPGNIMRFIDENGSSVYKLTDFGAARRLDEEESFTSIYGTEEYLDPNMFERAVLRSQRGQIFDASVDLWSLGVTVYHVATGQLPFVPYGGRTNSQTMYRITTEKETGVISGQQFEENGPIIWSRELPKTCLLSSSLKSIITPLLAGLMECDTKKRWTYEQFFDAVNSIMNMATMKVFSCYQGFNLLIYVNKTDRFASFQEQIARETEIPASEQLILYHNRDLSEIIDPTAEIFTYPKNILLGQLFLYNRERVDQQRLIMPAIPPFPEFPSYTNYDKDAYLAHKCSSIGCLTERWITTLLKCQELMKQSETLLRDFLVGITNRIDNCIPDMCKLLGETKKRQDTFYTSYTQIFSILDILTRIPFQSIELRELCNEACMKQKKILQDKSPLDTMVKAENRTEEIKVYMSVLMDKVKEQERDAISSCVGCLDEDHCLQKAKHLCATIIEIENVFQKHRKQQRDLSSNEQQNHAGDRLRLTEVCVKLISVSQGHCLQNYQQVYRVVMKQAGLLMKNVQRTKKVEQNITSVVECQEKLSARVDRMQGDCNELQSEFTRILQEQISQQSAQVSVGMIKSGNAERFPSLVSSPMNKYIEEKISLELESLSDGSIQLQKLMEQNRKKLEESAL